MFTLLSTCACVRACIDVWVMMKQQCEVAFHNDPQCVILISQTPWFIVCPSNLTLAQNVGKFPVKQNSFYRRMPLDSIISQTNLVHPDTLLSSALHFSIVLPPTLYMSILKLPSFPSGFADEVFSFLLSPPLRLHAPHLTPFIYLLRVKIPVHVFLWLNSEHSVLHQKAPPSSSTPPLLSFLCKSAKNAHHYKILP